MRFDDAFDYLTECLKQLPDLPPNHRPSHNDRPYGCDVWVPNVILRYWQTRGENAHNISSLTEHQCRAFYDVAWELCRRGVLRPGQAAAKGMAGGGSGFVGDGYSLTATGRLWLTKISEAGHTDPSRMAELFANYQTSFGTAFVQRSVEAVSCYRSGNYLAACVMAGAASESLLIATAVAKTGNEDQVLAEYRTARGRGRVVSKVAAGAGSDLERRLTNAIDVLAYWRDDAAHGLISDLAETEAHTALTQLLGLAQLVSKYWERLTARSSPSEA